MRSKEIHFVINILGSFLDRAWEGFQVRWNSIHPCQNIKILREHHVLIADPCQQCVDQSSASTSKPKQSQDILLKKQPGAGRWDRGDSSRQLSDKVPCRATSQELCQCIYNIIKHGGYLLLRTQQLRSTRGKRKHSQNQGCMFFPLDSDWIRLLTVWKLFTNFGLNLKKGIYVLTFSQIVKNQGKIHWEWGNIYFS